MHDSNDKPTTDPREMDIETAQEVDPQSGRSDDPRVDPTQTEASGDAG